MIASERLPCRATMGPNGPNFYGSTRTGSLLGGQEVAQQSKLASATLESITKSRLPISLMKKSRIATCLGLADPRVS